MRKFWKKFAQRLDEIIANGNVDAHAVLIWLALIIAILALAGSRVA